MKKYVIKSIVLSLAVFTYINVFSASGNYHETMQVNIAKMYKAQRPDELVLISSVFYRISEKEKEEWFPLYYASYAMVRCAFFEKDADQVTHYLDVAQKYMDSLMKTNVAIADVHILQALIYSKRITSAGGAMKYLPLSNKALDKAQELDASNPRLFYCRGNNLFYTPSFFGGGKESAKPLFEKAKQLFSDWKSPNVLWPAWGAYHNQIMLDNCNKDE